MVPGIVASDKGCGKTLRSRRSIISGINTRRQADTILDLNTTISRNTNLLFKFNASRKLGVTATKHLANHRCDWIAVSRCSKEEIRMAVRAKYIFIVGNNILVLAVTAARKMGRTVIARIIS